MSKKNLKVLKINQSNENSKKQISKLKLILQYNK